ncbi:MAG: ATP-binding protein [Runella sp.]
MTKYHEKYTKSISCFFRFFALIVPLNFYNSSLQAQIPADSLEHWIKQYPYKDTLLISKMIALEKQYYVAASEKFGTYTPTIQKLSLVLGFNTGLSAAYMYRAYMHIKKGEYEEALKQALKRVEIEQRQNDLFGMADAYSLTAYVLSLTRSYDRALPYFEKAKKTAEQISDTPQNRTPKAKLLVKIMVNTNIALSGLQNHQASLQNGLTALRLLQKSDLVKNTDYFYTLAAIYISIANDYLMLQKPNKAYGFFEKAINIAEKQKISIGIARAYLGAFKSSVELKDFQKANIINKKLESMMMFNQFDSHEMLVYYDYLQKFQIQKQDFLGAYTSLKKYHVLNDSIIGNDQKKKIEELNIRFATAQKDQENRFLKERNLQIQSRNQIFSFGIVILLLFVLALSVLYYRLSHAKRQLNLVNQQLQNATETKDRLFSIIAHDLKTPSVAFEQLTKSLHYLIKKNDYERLLAVGRQTEFLAADLQSITNNLLYYSMIQLDRVPFRPSPILIDELFAILKDTMGHYALLNQQQLDCQSTPHLRVHYDLTLLTFILRNFLSNAIKFTPTQGRILLKAWQNTPQSVCIEVEDSGKGFDENSLSAFQMSSSILSNTGIRGEKGTGLGLYLCRELIARIGGTLSINSSSTLGGARVQLCLPSL